MTSMDLNSTYKEKPTLLWVIILIVAGVGLFYLVSGLLGLFTDFSLYSADAFDGVSKDIVDLVEGIAAITYMILGLITLLIAFLVFSGSKGGRTFLVIILFISIIGNFFGLIIMDITSIIWLVLALIVFVLLYQPPVKEYFRQTN